MRHGPERLAFTYRDPLADDKRRIFDRINRDRAEHRLAPLAYEPRAALVGDRFCADAATAGSFGHWDSSGQAPYVRFGLAGGVDYHAENAAAYSQSDGDLDESPGALGLLLHQQMMDERPPHDGHRRAILDPLSTHVGIGLGRAGGEFRLTEEFTRVVMDWIELPGGALRRGEAVTIAGRPLPEWEIGLVEIRHEPVPRPLAIGEGPRRGSYAYPSATVRSFRPKLDGRYRYEDGTTGNFPVANDGSFRLAYIAGSAPGYDVVLCYVRPRGNEGAEMAPGTAALIAIE